MPISRSAGTTSELVAVFFRDNRNVSTIGMANVSASSINFSWYRDNATGQSSGTCTTNTVLGTYSTTALTQISSTSTLGWYQFGLPDGALASGRSVVVHLWSRTSTAGVTPYSLEIDILDNIKPVSVSTLSASVSSVTGAVHVSSSGVNFGVSTLAASVSSVTGAVHVTSAGVNFGVSTLATSVSSVTGSVNASSFSRQVGVSSATVDFGVSTIAVGEKLVGVSTIAAAQKLVGVSTLATPAGVSSASVDFGVSTIAVSQKLVGVSTIAAAEKLVGVSTVTVAVNTSTMSTDVGVSTLVTSVDVSSASVLLGVSTLATSVDVSSSIMVSSNTVQINGATVQGDGTSGNLWRG